MSRGPTDTTGAPTPQSQTPAAPPAAARPRKRWIALSILLVLLIVGGVAGTLYWLHARQFESTDDAYVDGDVVQVSPQIAGRIKTVKITDNQEVRAGDLLAEIDATDFVTRVNQSQAALESAAARLQVAKTNVDLVTANTEATLAQARAGVETAQAAVTQEEAGIEAAQATVQRAQSQVESAASDVAAAQAEATRRENDLKRYDAVDPRAMSQQMRDTARSAAESAEAQLAAAKKKKAAADAQVAEAQSMVAEAKSKAAAAKSKVGEAQAVVLAAQTAPQQIASAQAQVKTAQAAVDLAQAELEAAKQQLAYTSITAPVAGRVTRRSVQPGQYVEAGRILLSLVEPDVWVTANFKETQLTHMRQGQPVEITIDAYPGQTFQGRVDSFQAGTGSRFSLMPPENATGNFVKVVQRVPVKITFEASAAMKAVLGPGMSAVPQVRIMGDKESSEPVAPATRDLKHEATKGTKEHEEQAGVRTVVVNDHE